MLQSKKASLSRLRYLYLQYVEPAHRCSLFLALYLVMANGALA